MNKKWIKKGIYLALTLMFALAITAIPSKTANAAKKLTYEDFKFTGRDADNMNNVYNAGQGNTWWSSCDTIEESNPKECIKTKRNITLTASKKKVFKKYGKVKLQKLSSDSPIRTIYSESDEDRKIADEKYALYTCKKGTDVYTLYFFFDKNNKVNMIFAKVNL